MYISSCIYHRVYIIMYMYVIYIYIDGENGERFMTTMVRTTHKNRNNENLKVYKHMYLESIFHHTYFLYFYEG